jgi:cold shock CspA family protein
VATGIIAPRFNTSKGWGFIKPDGGGPDVLLHVNELADGEHAVWLQSGARVAYDEVLGVRGMRAANVRVLTGEPEPGLVVHDLLTAAQFRDEVSTILAGAVSQLEEAARRHGWLG